MKTQLTFDDVKNTISKDFKNYYWKKLEENIEVELKSKYHPVIYEDVLSKLLSSV